MSDNNTKTSLDDAREQASDGWLKANQHLAGWIEAFGVIVFLALGLWQLRESRIALQAATESNQIALKSSATDLLTDINKIAIEHPELAGEHKGVQRLHLMRLDYCYRMLMLSRRGIITEDRFKAETEYLKWVAAQPEFDIVWTTFGKQYETDFQKWVDKAFSEVTLSGLDAKDKQ